MTPILLHVTEFIDSLKQEMTYNNSENEKLLNALDKYKFGPLNVNNVLFYVYINDDIVSFYIDRTSEIQDASNIQHHINNASAYIDIATDLDSRSAVLRFVSVNEEDNQSKSLRGKGVGTFLILYAITYLKLIGIISITLDDDSDNSRQDNNIYVKLGCKYDDEDGPEMTCDINEMINKWNFYARRYEIDNSIKPSYSYKSKRSDRFTKKPYQNGGKTKMKKYARLPRWRNISSRKNRYRKNTHKTRK
jgi:hypothetical protein